VGAGFTQSCCASAVCMENPPILGNNDPDIQWGFIQFLGMLYLKFRNKNKRIFSLMMMAEKTNTYGTNDDFM